VLDEGVIVEIVRPGTGDPVPDGEVGELVVTTLNPAYPLIRFGTGDLSAILPGPCPAGRTAPRIKGWMGRADQTTKVRGMFVHPSQVADIARRFPQVRKARLVVSGEKAEEQETDENAYLYRGIATRSFERRFTLAEHVKVSGARLDNGLLHIDLEREIPEEMKPRTIEIKSAGNLLEGETRKSKAA